MTTNNNTIKLDQFVKLAGMGQTGEQAKLMIQGGDVKGFALFALPECLIK